MIIFFELTFAYSTGPISDGRKHLLEVPDDLRNVPDILPRYAIYMTIRSNHQIIEKFIIDNENLKVLILI